uniref:Large ribosomal subunit protein uL23c n=1 Tax=Haplopteris elongata TaxID=451070 RepID=A0A3G5CTL6_9MONI|nr:ribosomal protein L23 [Haplopteris elongata]AYW16202.1 ribosomal protein L23 [Haplopteris elongata]
MDKVSNQVITEKSVQLLQQNQYTFQVYSKLTKTEMKNWIEGFFDVKLEGINSISLRNKSGKRINKSKYNSTGHKKMIVRLKQNYYIPFFLNQL